MEKVSVREIQGPLRIQYKSSPEAARVIDHARTIGADATDPFHSTVEPMPGCGATLPVGVHRAIGGMHDAPTPGDILCAALAACQESAIRMTANILGITLTSLEVKVTGGIDIRGALGIEREVPVGFQTMKCQVDLQIAEGTNPKLVNKLIKAAEYSCVVSQTLRSGVPVETDFNVN